MKANPLVLTIGLAIAATGIAILFVPGTFESMSMLSRDRRGEAAVRVGNQARLDGDRDPAFLDMLIDLNREYGDSTSEAAAIDDYLAKHPNDLGVLRKAVAYYENMQDNAALTAMLERVVALSKSPADIEKLARIYRLWGQFDKERKLLLANRQAKLSQAMAVRLGEYLLEDNEPGQAIASLEPVVDVLPCMREPTISPLHGEGGFAIKAAVPRADLPSLIRRIKERGGTDIVVSEIAQIVP